MSKGDLTLSPVPKLYVSGMKSTHITSDQPRIASSVVVDHAANYFGLTKVMCNSCSQGQKGRFARNPSGKSVVPDGLGTNPTLTSVLVSQSIGTAPVAGLNRSNK